MVTELNAKISNDIMVSKIISHKVESGKGKIKNLPTKQDNMKFNTQEYQEFIVSFE